jgi:hypothetical protein
MAKNKTQAEIDMVEQSATESQAIVPVPGQMLIDITSLVPSLKSVSDRIVSSLGITAKVEESLAKLLEDDSYGKDPEFLIEAHKTLAGSSSKLLDNTRKYMEAISKVLQVNRSMGAAAAMPKATDPFGSTGPNQGPTVTLEEIEESVGNSIAG